MKNKKSKSLKIFGGWFFGFIILTGILAGVASGEQFKIYELRVIGDNFKSSTTTSSSSSTGASSFNCDELQQTQAGKDFCGNIVNSQIYCKIKQTTDVVDGDGNVVGSEESPFFAGSPITTFELTDKPSQTDITDGGFLITVKLKCASDSKAITTDIFDEDNFFGLLAPSVKIPLKVKDGSLLLKVYSKDSQGVDHETFNTNLSFDELVLTDAKEKNLGDSTISSDRILVYIPSGNYHSQQKIVLSGNIDIVWRDFPSVNYRLHLDEEDIPTFREVSVTKSSIPDVIKCSNGEIRQGNVCVKQTNNGIDNSSPVTTLNEFQEAILCVQSGNYGCLLQDKFLPYLVSGIGGLFLIGAVTHNSPPKFDQFGNVIR